MQAAGGVLLGVGLSNLLGSGASLPVQLFYGLLVLVGLYGMFGQYVGAPIPHPNPKHIARWRVAFVIVGVVLFGGIYYEHKMRVPLPLMHIDSFQKLSGTTPNGVGNTPMKMKVWVKNDSDEPADAAIYAAGFIMRLPVDSMSKEVIWEAAEHVRAQADAEKNNLQDSGTINGQERRFLLIGASPMPQKDWDDIDRGYSTLFYAGAVVVKRNGWAIPIPFCEYTEAYIATAVTCPEEAPK